MKSFPLAKAVLTILFVLIIWNYFSGVAAVPFHPDESTQIYMSADATQNPLEAAYTPRYHEGDRWRYRLIDSPISRTLIGWGLYLRGQQPNQVDWDWSANWEMNLSAGAYPTMEALLVARWSVAWMFPLTCLFLYLLARKIDGRPTAIISLLLFSTNALVLLHTRRAMAESALVCTFCALTWLLVDFRKIPWLAAIAAGLAVNAKQTAIPLAGIGGLQMLFFPQDKPWGKRLVHFVFFIAIIGSIFWSLNPVFWKYPLDAVREGLAQRADLTSRMQADYHTAQNPLEQSIIMIAQVFIQPPAVYDVMNYSEATKPAEKAYLGQSQNSLFRGFVGGAFLFILTIVGWIIMWRHTSSSPSRERLPHIILLIITVVSMITLMFFTAAPFQRYYLILIPLFTVAQAVAIKAIWDILIETAKKRTAQPGSPM
jgi:4-amino-4-deoxy-L-arabinose transferase-like glycosyltransferase